MSRTKISALPAASTLTGAETIPLVQGGVTKKVTTDQFLTAANPSYTGTLTGGTGVVNLGSGQFVKDASGNLGLGVTPSAWSGFTAFQLPNGGYFAGGGGYTNFTTNVYNDGSQKYINSGAYALSYQQHGDGAHKWYTAPTGTAGNPISFTQAMTLTSSGELLVNRIGSSGLGKLNVEGGADFTNGNVLIGRDTGSLGVGTASPTTKIDAAATGACIIRANGGSGAGQGGALYASTGGTTIAAIGDAAAIVGGAAGTTAMVYGSVPLAFGVNGVERARIDASGNLLVGATSASGKFHLTNANNVSGDTAGYFALGSNTNNASSYFLQCVTSGVGAKAYILGNGNLQNANNSYGAFSDAKLKENITDASPKLDDLMQVRVVNYRFKADPTHKQLGVIAQELEQVFPGLVEETPDRDSDGNDLGTTTKSVKYSVFVPMLIKAVQEQQAQIEALTARLTALESNLKESPWLTTKKPLSQALLTHAPTPSPSQTHASE